MRNLLGIFITFLVLALATYFVLQIWDIDLISSENFNKSLLTLGLLFLLSIALTIITPFFFKNHSKGYDTNSGNVAQSKNEK